MGGEGGEERGATRRGGERDRVVNWVSAAAIHIDEWGMEAVGDRVERGRGRFTTGFLPDPFSCSRSLLRFFAACAQF